MAKTRDGGKIPLSINLVNQRIGIEMTSTHFAKFLEQFAEKEVFDEALSEIINSIEKFIKETVEKAFDEETSPEGIKWADNGEFYYRQKKSSKILYESGLLKSGVLEGINFVSRRDNGGQQNLTFGIDVQNDARRYWEVHQFGSDEAYSYNRVGDDLVKNPNKKNMIVQVPARPFIPEFSKKYGGEEFREELKKRLAFLIEHKSEVGLKTFLRGNNAKNSILKQSKVWA